MKQLKEKYENEKGRLRKIQILTLAPVSWSREKVMNYFRASEREAREAIHIRTKDGIRALLRKTGRPMGEDVKLSVKKFYEDDSVSYCPTSRKKRRHPRSTKATAFP